MKRIENFVRNSIKVFTNNKLKFTYYDDIIHIENYVRISHFENNEIRVHHENGYLIVKGKNLFIKDLLIHEVKISGEINKVEFRWYNEK